MQDPYPERVWVRYTDCLFLTRAGTIDEAQDRYSAIRWAALLPRTGEGPVRHCFDDGFFDWLNSQIIMIEYYPYAGMNFTGDPE